MLVARCSFAKQTGNDKWLICERYVTRVPFSHAGTIQLYLHFHPADPSDFPPLRSTLIVFLLLHQQSNSGSFIEPSDDDADPGHIIHPSNGSLELDTRIRLVRVENQNGSTSRSITRSLRKISTLEVIHNESNTDHSAQFETSVKEFVQKLAVTLSPTCEI